MSTSARIAIQPVGTVPIQIEEVTIPDPLPTQVLIKQYASGICHSQLHQIHRKRKQPMMLGHESTGAVMKTGSDVTHVKEGDTVMVTWLPRNSATAPQPPTHVSLETSNGFAGTPEGMFTWATHTLVDEQFVVKVSPDIQPDISAIIGCAVMTGAGAVMNTANVQAGESVAVFGVGGVGLSAISCAKKIGAKIIIGVDLIDEKLELARKFGATHVINAGKEDPVKAIHQLTVQQGKRDPFTYPVSGVDYAFDCIGIPLTMVQVLRVCRTGQFGVRAGGKAILVGVPQTQFEINAIDMLIHEKQFIGSLGGSCIPDRDFSTFVEWAQTGELDLEAMVTARYSLDQVNEAVSDLEKGIIVGRAIFDFEL